MRAVWYRIVFELRARWRANLAVVLLIAIGGGLALAAYAGARRTTSAYPRFLDASSASDYGTASGPLNALVGLGTVDIDEVRALPETSRIETIRFLFAGLRDERGTQLVGGGSLAAFAQREDLTMEHVRAVEGRLPRSDALDEVAIGFEVARSTGVEVGDRVEIEVLSPAALNDPTTFGQGGRATVATMDVVGTAAFPGAFPPNPRFGQFVVSEAFVDRWFPGSAYTYAVLIEANHGVTEQAFKAALDRLGGGRQLFFSQAVEAADVQRSIDLEAGALKVFAVITAVTALFIVGQALARVLLQDREQYAVLRALGMTPWQRRAAAFGRVGSVAVAGAAAAVGVAWAMSPATPFGVARIAEPRPGFVFDGYALGVGAMALLGAVLLATVPAALRLSLRRQRSAVPRAGGVSRALAGIGAPPTAVAGVRMAVAHPRGSDASARTVVVGVAAAIAALVAAVSIGGSMNKLLGSPRLYGWDADAAIGNVYAPGLAEAIGPMLEQRDDIAALAVGNPLSRIRIVTDEADATVGVHAFDMIRGAVHPTIAEGRWPDDTDEIVLGTRPLRALGIEIGDLVTVDGGTGPATMEVVGRGVFPSFGDPNIAELGDGAGMTFEAYRRLAPSVEPGVFLVRFAAGTDVDAALAELEASPLLTDAIHTAERPGDLDGLARVDGLPIVLAGTLALLATATLVHALSGLVRRRRRELAILSTLGFVGAQIRRTVVWQSVTLTLLAVAAGAPLGIAGGRWLWRLIADRVGFLSAPVPGLVPAATIAALTVAVAAIVALVPAQRAVSLRPAHVLRSE